jgi:Xaa-Pro dipeptidase
MGSQWSSEWSTPVFSLVERDRRWTSVRNLMARDGIDVIICLPNTNRRDRGQQDARYLTQLGENCEETTVVFPLDGEVVAWQTRAGATPSSNWLTDIRAAHYGEGAAAVIPRLREMGFLNGTIGVAGLTGGVLARTRSPEGEANWYSLEMIKQAFPDARLVSATPPLSEARYRKSAEEIDFLRTATAVAEQSLQAVLETARAGVSEREVFARMLYASASAGGSMPVMFGWISGRAGAPHTRLEQPTFRSLATGDALLLEIEGRWAGYIGQVDESFSIGPASDELKDGIKLAWECFNRALAALKPGITAGELTEASRVAGLGGRGAAGLTMHGRGLGDDGPLLTPRSRSPEVLQTCLEEDCCFILKPSARIDGKDLGRWGDTVVVRSSGAERLGTRVQQVYELA